LSTLTVSPKNTSMSIDNESKLPSSSLFYNISRKQNNTPSNLPGINTK